MKKRHSRSEVQRFRGSEVQRFKGLEVQRLFSSVSYELSAINSSTHPSTPPAFHHSTIPPFHHSIIPTFPVFLPSFPSLKILRRPERGLEAVGDVDLFIDIEDVGLDRVLADEELLGNLFVAIAGCQGGEDFFFSAGEDIGRGFYFVWFGIVGVHHGNALFHNASGDPVLPPENAAEPFLDSLQWVIFIKHPADPEADRLCHAGAIMLHIEQAQMTLGYDGWINGLDLDQLIFDLLFYTIQQDNGVVAAFRFQNGHDILKVLITDAVSLGLLPQIIGQEFALCADGADDIDGFIG